MSNNMEKLIEVTSLQKSFPVTRKKDLKAVDNISFSIYKGETLGLVGESGCGKSTLGKTILRLHDKTAGKVLFKNKDVYNFNKSELLSFRKEAQIIFQDPYSSLDPRMTNSDIISEGLNVHFEYSNKEKDEKVKYLLQRVGLSRDYAARYPHELSGGQRQRIGIA